MCIRDRIFFEKSKEHIFRLLVLSREKMEDTSPDHRCLCRTLAHRSFELFNGNQLLTSQRHVHRSLGRWQIDKVGRLGFHLPQFLFGKIELGLSLIHISEPTRLLSISYAVFCLKKKKHN